MWPAWLVLGREQEPCQLSSLLNEFGNSCIRWVDINDAYLSFFRFTQTMVLGLTSP